MMEKEIPASHKYLVGGESPTIDTLQMKRLTWCLVLPLTIISFGTLTKWWYVLPVDSPDTLMVGFPFAFVAEGWFTSNSMQFFVIELCLDLLIYFLFWFFFVLILRRVWIKLIVSTIVTRLFWMLAVLTISFWTVILTISEKSIKLKRDWDMEVLVTGYKFTWANTERPELSKYDPGKK